MDPMIEATADVRGAYRYTLIRTWDSGLEPVVFVMLNPSMADATLDDPTIRLCVSFAKREGLGGVVIVNLYAYRATDPRVMFAAADPVGPDNDRVILEVTTGRTVIVAWGHHAKSTRVAGVLGLLPSRVFALGVTRGGHPRDPLYVRGDAPLVSWPAA